MPPKLAAVGFVVGIAGLFLLDRDRTVRTSTGLWVAVAWLWINGSRPVSAWLAIAGFGGSSSPTLFDSPSQYLEGSPIDRAAFAILLVLGIVVLARSRLSLARVLRLNLPIVIFFTYAALSIFWSDYPGVASKRWFKGIGDVIMVLVVLHDVNPEAAIKRFLARISFVLIPLSVLFIRYYPEFGRGYLRWTWTPFYTGVAVGKNELGATCLVCGVASVWRCFRALHEEEGRRRTRTLMAHGIILIMVLWLLWVANSMTSLSCFVLASGLIAATRTRLVARKKWVLHLLVAGIITFVVCVLFLNIGPGLVEDIGRNSTLTGRTDVWDLVLGMTGNPVVGTGFESFWLGKRLETIWSVYWWHPNEAHNGYLEIFLNLGYAGVALLALMIANGYRSVVQFLRCDPAAANLNLAYFVIALAYNFTESATRIMHPVWIFFLFAIIIPTTRARATATELLPVSSSELAPSVDEVNSIYRDGSDAAFGYRHQG